LDLSCLSAQIALLLHHPHNTQIMPMVCSHFQHPIARTNLQLQTYANTCVSIHRQAFS
jgi:3-oxoacyl-[acyl-carrier-protein] synthase III